MHGSQDLAGGSLGAAARLEGTGLAVELAGAVAHHAVLVRQGSLEGLLARPERLAGGADVRVGLVVEGEVGSLERAVLPLGFVDDRDVGLDPTLVDEPGQVLGRAVGGVGGQALGPEAEAFLGALDHGACRADLGLADRAARLDVDDDGVIQVDQVVRGVGEEGMALVSAGPLGGGVRARDELRLDLAGGAPGPRRRACRGTP